MAPTPSAGKATGGGPPKTPTKLGRKPQSNSTPKLGQGAQSASTPASGAKKPSTPSTSSAKKPDTPSGGDAASKASGAAQGAKDKTDSTTKDAKPDSKDLPEGADKIDTKDVEDDGDEGPLSKVQKSTEEAASDADDVAKNAAEDAKDTAQDTADDAEDTAEDTADDATEKAGDVTESNDDDDATETGDDATETGDDATEAGDDATDSGKKVSGDAQDKAKKVSGDAQDKGKKAANDTKKTATDTKKSADDTKNTGGGALKGAKGLADKAQGLAGKASEDPSKAAEDAKDTAGDAAEDAQDTAEGATGDAKKVAGDAGDVAEDAAEDAGDTAEDVADDAGDAAEDVADDAEDATEDAKAKTEDVADDAQDTAEDTADDAEDTAEDAEGTSEDVEGTAEKAKGTGEDAAEKAEDAAEDTAEKAEGATEDAADKAEGTTDDTAGKAEGATEDVESAADDADETAEDAQDGPDLSKLPVDLSVLKGLEVGPDGLVQGPDGPIGKLAEGDAEDLEGYPVGDDGEILDEDGDLVGRVELLPDEIKKQLTELKEKGELPEGVPDDILDQLPDTDDAEDDAQLPGLEVLNGLTCGSDGYILNEEGDTVGEVTEGDPEELMKATLNEHGEFIDDDGNVVGHAEVHPDAAGLFDQGEDAAEDAGEDAGEDAAEAVDGDAVEKAGEEATEGIEDQLPGVEALEGRELNDAGEIVDEDGNVLGQLEGDEAEAVKEKLESGDLKAEDLQINEEGEVVDSEGNVIGTVGLAEGAAEKLKEQLGPVSLDLRILDGKKINKKGKILDEEGEVIGELVEGELSDCAGKKANDKGEVLDKDGKVIGKVSVVSGEAAETATKELVAELGEVKEDEAEGEEEAGEEGEGEGEGEGEAEAEEEEDKGPKFKIPSLSTLEGLKVNKKGKILDEDGEEIGELTDGELAECAGKKVNDKGEVLDAEGDVIGRVKTLPKQLTEEEIENGVEDDAEVVSAEEAGVQLDEAQDDEGVEEGQNEEGAEEAQEDEGADLPPLTVLEGLTVNKSGKLIDSNGVVVGELTEGDAKKLSKSGIKCDGEGQFWDNKGHVIGRAQTVEVEDAEEESAFAGLEGLIVTKDGYVEDENGNKVGIVTEGDAKKLVGRAVDEDGDIIDKRGSVVGHAERWSEEEEEEVEPDAIDYSSLVGKKLNKSGMVIGDEGVPVARLVEGNAKELAGKRIAEEGQIWNDAGKVVGRVELIPENEREAKAEGVFAGLQGLRVVAGGKIADEDENIVGEIVEGNPKRLVGLAVDEDGDIVDRYGNVKGHAEPIAEEEEADTSILKDKLLNKQGFVVNEEQIPIGKLVEGNVKELAGRRCDEKGLIYNDTGKQVGRCEVLPDNERVAKPEGIFAGLEGLHVNKDGYVEDESGNVVGVVTEGTVKRLVGLKVDEDGDILDKFGNTKGRAEVYEEAEEEAEDLSSLEGCTVNKAGNVVDSQGSIKGRVVEGDAQSMIGKKVDGKGQIWDNSGKVVGRAERTHGQDTTPEGPFAGFDDAVVTKEGTVVTPSGDIIGRIVEGDVKKLVNHHIDESGDILDKNGNVIGTAERWEPEEKERRVNPMSGRKVNREGEVRDEGGDVIGRLTDGDLGRCVGCEIDDNGNVIDSDGQKIGEATLLENIVEEEEEEQVEERSEEAEIAEKMANICSQTLERVQPVCKQITEHMETADRTPKEELDEEQLVNDVKPLIEEGGRILQECNGALRGLDPDGHIAAKAKANQGTHEASPEEHRLAEVLKELTTTVVTTIDGAKKKLNDMPHAKKKLNPLWSLLSNPLTQILGAVALLLVGVINLLGQILSFLGLSKVVSSVLGPLRLENLLSSFGLGGIFGGDDKKKKKAGGGVSSLPLVGGMFGGK